MHTIRAAALAVIAILRGLSFWRRDSAGGLILLALHRPDRLEWSWCLSWHRLRPTEGGGWKFYRLGRQQERFGAGTPWGDLEFILQHRSAPARAYRLPSVFYCLALVAGLIALPPMEGCAQVNALLSAGSSATVNRSVVVQTVTAGDALEDAATAYINGCVAAHKATGICAPDAVHAVGKAFASYQTARNALEAFAAAHTDAELGASGLYEAFTAAKSTLQAVLSSYGIGA